MSVIIRYIAFLVILCPFATYAASFDCSKATTEIEIEICNTATLSRLDEEIAAAYFSINKGGRYFAIIKRSQITWNNKIREANEQSFLERLEFLFLAKEINECTATEKFKDCVPDIEKQFQICLARGNYTTFSMNVCSRVYIDLLNLIEPFETSIWRQEHSEDTETVKLFDDAYLAWKNYIELDCKWQASEYRDGTIRQQIWAACMMAHLEQRLGYLNGANLFWK